MKNIGLLFSDVLWAALVLVCLSMNAFGLQISVTTWHNDIGRTGQNITETILTPGDVQQHTVGTVTSETFCRAV